MTLAIGLMGQRAAAQTSKRPPEMSPAATTPRDPNPLQTISLTNTTSQNDYNEIVFALRNRLDPTVKVYLVPSQNTIVMRGSSEQIAMAQTILAILTGRSRRIA